MIAEKVSRHIEDPSGIEHEYCVSNGQTYINRLVPNEKANVIVTFDKQGPQEILFDPGMRLKGEVQSGRVLFSQVGEAPSLASDAVEVVVAMTGLNWEDVQVINGSDISTVFSHEMGGVVQRIGDSVRSVAVGDRVVGFSFDHLSTHQVVSETMIQKLDEEDSMAEMVGLPMAYATALHGLKT